MIGIPDRVIFDSQPGMGAGRAAGLGLIVGVNMDCAVRRLPQVIAVAEAIVSDHDIRRARPFVPDFCDGAHMKARSAHINERAVLNERVRELDEYASGPVADEVAALHSRPGKPCQAVQEVAPNSDARWRFVERQDLGRGRIGGSGCGCCVGDQRGCGLQHRLSAEDLDDLSGLNAWRSGRHIGGYDTHFIAVDRRNDRVAACQIDAVVALRLEIAVLDLNCPLAAVEMDIVRFVGR